MDLIIYPRLSTCSKRAILKERKKWGHIYVYVPKKTLIDRLRSELGWSEQQVLDQIWAEREWLIKHRKYYR